MAWSFRLGRFFGVDVFIHYTFLVLVLLFGFFAYREAPAWAVPWQNAVLAMGSVCVMFVCVLMHEYGHVLMARKYGIATRDIILLPIGGVARLDHVPERNSEEILVALAGPAVNAVLALLLFALLRVVNISMVSTFIANSPGWAGSFVKSGILEQLMLGNLVMLGFNMIPAFPMDGGRVLRALLGMGIGREKATQAAAFIGKILAVGMALYGLYLQHYILVLAAAMVWVGASREAADTQRSATLRRYKASQAMLRHFLAFRPEQTLWDIMEAADQTFQLDFPILENETLVGVLPQRIWINATHDGAQHHQPLSALALPRWPQVHADMDLHEVEQIMQTEGVPMACVMSGHELLGILMPDVIRKFIALREAGVPASR